MRSLRAARFAFLGALPLASGCVDQAVWQDRHGPAPVLDAAQVQASTQNYRAVLGQFILRAGLPGPPSFGSPDWYFVTEAGFGYVDELCERYIRDLFILNREKDRLKATLNVLDKASNAVLSVTGASIKSMTILAQAFGLGINTTELFAGSYLYQLNPASLQSFVKELRVAYRDGAASRRALIVTPAATYQTIQDYLSLCLPPTIEARINEHVARAKAVSDPTTGTRSPSFNLLVGSQRLTREEIRSSLTRQVTFEPLRSQSVVRPPPQPIDAIPGASSLEAKLLTPSSLQRYRIALCQPKNGSGITGDMRKAIQSFKAGYYDKALSQTANTITPPDINALEAADCSRRVLGSPLIDPYEVGVFTANDPAKFEAVLKNALAKAKSAGADLRGVDLQSPNLRDAVRALRKFYAGKVPGMRTDIIYLDQPLWSAIQHDGAA